jgi:hypothetical protein
MRPPWVQHTDDPVIVRLRRAIDRTAAQFFEHPFDYLYEADLRSTLHHFARQEFEDDRVPLRAHDPKRWACASTTVGRVKSEYPSGLRFDLAVLPDVLDPTKNMWCQPVRAAVEIKLWQPDGTGNDFEGDVLKLESYLATCRDARRHFCGLILLFVHPGRLANSGTCATPNEDRIPGGRLRHAHDS